MTMETPNLPLDAEPPVRPALRLAQIELLDTDGRVQQAWDVAAWPVDLGRALDNQIVLHDPHVAAHHARLDLDADGRLVLLAGASCNGVRIDEGTGALGLESGARAVLAPLATWHLGASRLRVRRPGDALPDELPLSAAVAAPTRRVTLALLAAMLAWAGATLWLESNADGTWEDYLPGLLALLGGLALWSAMWGVATKIFTRHFVLLPHLRIVLTCALAIIAAEAALAVVAFVFDWPWASRARSLVAWALAAVMLAQHLRIVLPTHGRRIGIAVGTVAALGLSWTMAMQWQRTDRLFGELYSATLLPPSWRLASAQPPQVLVDDLRALEAPLLEQARKAAAKDAEP